MIETGTAREETIVVGSELADTISQHDFWNTSWQVQKFNNRDINDFIESELQPYQRSLFRDTVRLGQLDVLLKRPTRRALEAALDVGSFTLDELATAVQRGQVKFHEVERPDDVVESEGNILVTAGINAMLTLLIGGGGTAFNNTNAYLGVGDSSTAAAIGQTDLQAATNKLRKGMNATFPTTPASGSTQFQSTFGTSDANFAWNEVGCFNASSGNTMLNRAVPGGGLGTKASGATWTLTLTVTIT